MRSAFPVVKSILVESFRDIQAQKSLFTSDMEEAFCSIPYLMAVVV